MEPNFHSTVLARPDDGDARQRDILNPASSPATQPAHASLEPPPPPPPPRPSFSLRSPTQSEFRQPVPFASPSASSVTATATNVSSQQLPASRSILNSTDSHPFAPPASVSSSAIVLPPASSSPAAATAGEDKSARPKSIDDRHYHRSSILLSPSPTTDSWWEQDKRERAARREREERERDQRDKPASGSFYDPLTDITSTKERKPSSGAVSWHESWPPHASTPKVHMFASLFARNLVIPAASNPIPFPPPKPKFFLHFAHRLPRGLNSRC